MHKELRSLQRCASFCTASRYNLSALAQFFRRKGFLTHISRDVLHVSNVRRPGDIFFFDYGAFVAWGYKKNQEERFIEYTKEFSIEPLSAIEQDSFLYQYGEETALNIHERFRVDIITLDSDDSQIKLAISYGLSQSVKLVSFEQAIQDAVKKNIHLPEEMAQRGSISLSRQAIFQRMGEIFMARSSINLSSEYLDVPEFFWRNTSVEPFYIMTKKFLDLPSRVMALNQKLDVLQELLDILSSQVQHRYSSILESIIILLILVEILISLFQFHLW